MTSNFDGNEKQNKDVSPKLSSFMKGLKVLEFVGNASSQKGIIEISNNTGIEKSAVQRMANSLTRTGYFIRDPQTRKYYIGPKALQLGYGYLVSSPLVTAAMPHLFYLSETVDEPLSLSVMLENKMIMIVRIRKSSFHHPHAFQGEQQPIYCTAPGRAILAHMPRQEANEILGAVQRKKLTPFTKIGIDEIGHDLDLTLSRGYAIQEDEFTLGEINFGAPIFDANDCPVAAIAIGVLKSKGASAELESKITPALLVTASSISKAIS